jgi:DNA polymerase-1
VIWARDYKQLELRIAAARSRDPNLMAAVRSADGPHVDFMNRIYEMTGQKIAKVAAKQGNFNAAYRGHMDMLRTILQKQRVFMSDNDLTTIVDSHRAAYPGYYAYGDDVIDFARRTGYSETAFGRRRYEPDINNPDRRIAMHAERALLNHTIQGTAADMLKIAMRLEVPVLKYYDAHMALQIHDEIMGWVPDGVADDFIHDLDRAIAVVQLPGVDFEVDGGLGRTWHEAKA